VFNPYLPGAFDRAREQLARLPDSDSDSDVSAVKTAISVLLDRLERDPVFRAAWWSKRRREQALYDKYGAQLVAGRGVEPAREERTEDA